jgi:hypothetical protein
MRFRLSSAHDEAEVSLVAELEFSRSAFVEDGDDLVSVGEGSDRCGRYRLPRLVARPHVVAAHYTLDSVVLDAAACVFFAGRLDPYRCSSD